VLHALTLRISPAEGAAIRISGYLLDMTDDEAFDLTMSVAAGQLDASGIEKRLRLVPRTG